MAQTGVLLLVLVALDRVGDRCNALGEVWLSHAHHSATRLGRRGLCLARATTVMAMIGPQRL